MNGSQSRHTVAAGAVVSRKGGEVLLVHRPKYDDWSFPKGKLDPGEIDVVAAVREVEEETGLTVVLGQRLADQHYEVRTGTKEVRYWTARVHGADAVTGYVRANEIDEVVWLGWDEAARRLTYPYDRVTLAQAHAAVRRPAHLVLQRHAEAVPRAEWGGRDRKRPLTSGGHLQAPGLVDRLGAWTTPDTRLLTSPARRCVDTVADYGLAHGLVAEPVVALAEDAADEQALEALLAAALGTRSTTVLCTHRPVLPVLTALLGLPRTDLAPGAALVVHHHQGRVIGHEVVEAPATGAPGR